MKTTLRFPAGIVLGFLGAGVTPPISAQVSVPEAAAASGARDLRTIVNALEDDFLAQLETTADPERLFDDYESKLKQLMAKNPGQPEPYLGLSELLEKCGHERALRLVEEVQARPNLPENVQRFYAGIRTTLNLVGTKLDLSLESLTGEKINLGSHAGKVLLIDFWATWCGPCVQEIPRLKEYYRELQPEGLEVVGVSFDDERGKLEQFIQARQVPWRQIHAIGAQRETVARALSVTRGYLPTVFLVGRDGRIRHTFNTRFKLKDKIVRLLAER
jgi:peroxiredoxin